MDLLPGWQNYIDYTIPAEKITGDLTHFPICIQISESAGINNVDLTPIFDEVGTNYKKIAVTKSDGTTQLYVEVVSWDNAVDEYAELWVSKDDLTLSNGVAYTLRVYFDNDHADNDSYVGVTGSTPAQNVWDSNFKLVCHMEDNPDTSNVMDSTSNDNDGSKLAANEPIEATGKIGEGQDFDANDDKITISDDDTLDLESEILLEAWVYLNDDLRQNVFNKGGQDSPNYLMESESGKKMVLKIDDTSYADTITIPTGQWVYYAFSADGSNVKVYRQGNLITTLEQTSTLISDVSDLIIGYTDGWGGVYVNGTIDEGRISSSKRSDAWVGASYETQRDQFYNCGDFVHLTPIALFCAT